VLIPLGLGYVGSRFGETPKPYAFDDVERRIRHLLG
jgi:hypothetical protein